MSRLLRDLICVMIGVVLVLAVACAISLASSQDGSPTGFKQEAEPLDIYQLQTFLSEKTDPTTGKPYYTGEIDGDCGPLTHYGRNRYCADRDSAKYMTPSGKPRK